MLTRCPQCSAWFRVRAEQLSVANGLVTCGRCEQVFNALASLLEEGAAAPPSVPPRIEPVAPAPEPALAALPVAPAASTLRFVAVAATTITTPTRGSTAASVSTTPVSVRVATSSLLGGVGSHDGTALAGADLQPGLEAAAVASEPAPVHAAAASHKLSPMSPTPVDADIADFDFAAVDDIDPGPCTDEDATASFDDDDHHAVPPATQEVPAVLLDDLAALTAPPRESRVAAIAWAVFGLLLATVAAIQVAFMERQLLLVQVPAATRLIDTLCARLPCLERRPAALSVRLLARDVREHPSYRDALLVNATIVNEAKSPSPYPVIDLRLRDAAGNVLSARQFQPGEYLDQSITLGEGMPSERPVYIVLELAGSASNAVSFEFTFL